MTVGANKKQHYWLREDFDDLMDLVSQIERKAVGAAPAANCDPRAMGSSLAYPKTTEGAYRELRLRGLKCDAATLLGLVEQGVVRPAGEPPDLQWTKADIDA